MSEKTSDTRTNKEISMDVAGIVIDKLKGKEFGFQSTRVFSAPSKLSGESIPSISFSLLSQPDAADHRWCSFNEAKKYGFKLKANSHSVKAVLEKSVLVVGGHGEKKTAITFYPLFNFSNFYAAEPNALARLPKVEKKEASAIENVGFVGQALGFIINDPRDPGTIDLVANGTNGLVEIDPGMSDEELSSHILYAMAIITRNEVRPDDADHPSRNLLVEAFSTSMMCAEYGLACPKILVDQVNTNLDDLIKFLEEDPMNIISIAKSAWAVRGNVVQYTPVNFEALKETGIYANTVVTYPGELFSDNKPNLA